MTRFQVPCLKSKNVLRYRIKRLSAAMICSQTLCFWFRRKERWHGNRNIRLNCSLETKRNGSRPPVTALENAVLFYPHSSRHVQSCKWWLSDAYFLGFCYLLIKITNKRFGCLVQKSNTLNASVLSAFCFLSPRATAPPPSKQNSLSL